MVPITTTPAPFIPALVSLCQPHFLKVCVINSMLSSSCPSRAQDAIAGCRWIRLPRKHFVGYVSHKGDRGHDSAEPVSSEGEGAGTASPGPQIPCLQPAGWGAQKGLWKHPGGAKREEGHRVSPESTLPHRQAIWSQEAPPPAGGLQSGRWGSLELAPHYKANGNPTFPGCRECQVSVLQAGIPPAPCGHAGYRG